MNRLIPITITIIIIGLLCQLIFIHSIDATQSTTTNNNNNEANSNRSNRPIPSYSASNLLSMAVLKLVGGFIAIGFPLMIFKRSLRAKRQKVIPLCRLKPGEPLRVLYPNKTTAAHSTNTDTDILIIGAGVAGAALAAALGKRGYKVTIIERNLNEQHRIIGELLQPLGVERLTELDLLESLDNYDSQLIEGYCILFNEKLLPLKYPIVEYGQAVGRSFHNGRFVQRLREIMKQQSTVQSIEGTVNQLIYSNTDSNNNKRVTGVNYKIKDPNTGNWSINSINITAALTIVADGPDSSFRKSLLTNDASTLSSFLGLILDNCELPYNNRGHVILANPTPILAYPISSTEVRMLIDFPSGTIPNQSNGDIQHHLLNYVRPQLPESMRDSFTNAVNDSIITDPVTGNISYKVFPSRPNRSLPARPKLVPGTLLLGDIFNMRHPLTGGGMSVAFTDSLSIVQFLSTVRDFNDYQLLDSLVLQHYSNRDSPVRVINMLADALYAVFCESNPYLRSSCFDYLYRGGFWSAGPVSFLSGISCNQSFLIFHFFSVALYSFKLLFPIPTPYRIYWFIKSIRTAVSIMMPLIVQENKSITVKILSAIVRTIFWA